MVRQGSIDAHFLQDLKFETSHKTEGAVKMQDLAQDARPRQVREDAACIEWIQDHWRRLNVRDDASVFRAVPVNNTFEKTSAPGPGSPQQTYRLTTVTAKHLNRISTIAHLASTDAYIDTASRSDHASDTHVLNMPRPNAPRASSQVPSLSRLLSIIALSPPVARILSNPSQSQPVSKSRRFGARPGQRRVDGRTVGGVGGGWREEQARAWRRGSGERGYPGAKIASMYGCPMHYYPMRYPAIQLKNAIKKVSLYHGLATSGIALDSVGCRGGFAGPRDARRCPAIRRFHWDSVRIRFFFSATRLRSASAFRFLPPPKYRRHPARSKPLGNAPGIDRAESGSMLSS
ncbi:hypothetical protein B0H17DRAFT_1126894 [Mycena rosella]|uniref:Uncharacterized protein n=1 Tax=Mycena rosella TaxID=1033263 RepID=A0AAD7M7L7_MYCRO|nr:hypothetical protein B0H17DRAFT_1126894 [Mycena rosella]